MAGISDKAIKMNYAQNKYKFNAGTELQNKEFSDGSGLEMYETDFRGYDPQIGRFAQIDPLADINEDQSSYVFANDNPISFNDPLGLDADDIQPAGPRPQPVPVCQSCDQPKPDPGKNLPGPQPSPSPGAKVDPSPKQQSGKNGFAPAIVVTTGAIAGGSSSFLAGLATGGLGIIVGGIFYTAYEIAHTPHPSPTGIIPADIGIGVPKININQNLINQLASGLTIALTAADLDRLAQDIISKDRKGSINKEFPDQYRDRTLKDIEKAAKAGEALAKKAVKLLKDGRFRK